MSSTANTKTIAVERNRINEALTKLRPLFSEGTPDLEILAEVLRNGHGALTPEKLADFAQEKKRFSTAEAMNHFQVGKYKVAGSLAALTAKGIIEKAQGTDENGYSVYTYVETKATKKTRK